MYVCTWSWRAHHRHGDELARLHVLRSENVSRAHPALDERAQADWTQQMTWFEAVVHRVTELTPDVRQIELALTDPAEIAFAAGQFVSFEVSAPEWPYPITRSYSIASSPSDRSRIDLLLNRVPGGRMSSHLFGLRPGDRSRFRGPIGTFCLGSNERDLLFVATGTGIAPIRSMLLSLASHNSSRHITLFWGLRTRQDMYYQQELAGLRDRLPAFSYVTTLSRPDDEWTGACGTVTRLVESRIATVANLDAYVCGSQAMIKDVTAALNRKGLCPVHREQYYRDDTSAAS